MVTKVIDTVEGKHKSISKLIPNQFPLHVRENYPNFINFIQHYYKFLEQDGNVIREIYNLPENFSIDKTREEFLEFFYQELAPTLPNDIVADKKKLLRFIKQFYLAKGTEASVEFLFRIVYNDIATVSYPGELILRCSDGEWSKKTIIKTTSNTDISIVGRKIFGDISGAVAIIDKVTTTNVGDLYYDILELSNLSGVFLAGETIQTRDSLQQYTSILSGHVWKVEVQKDSSGSLLGGVGYSVGETIPVTESSFSDAIIKVNSIDDVTGAIKTIIVENSGYGYISTFNITNANNKGASLKCYVGGVFYEVGSYLSQRGLLSGTSVIQDSYKYQTFSYVVSSNIALKDYELLLRSTTHPAGLLLLGNVNIEIEKQTNNSFTALDAEITIF